MGFGLRAINRIAGASLLDRPGLRKPAQAALYQGSRLGFRGAGALARGLGATQRLIRPARLSSGASHGQFDLTLTEEQQMLREAAASFASEKMRPAAQAADTAGAAPAEVLADNRKPNSLQASMAKAKAGRGCVDIALSCVELAGTLGYAEGEHGHGLLEKWARDAKILDIFEGTQQIQQLIVARRLLGKTSAELR